MVQVLNKAKKLKNDEFYTYYKDIQNELIKYGKNIFYNKKIICPCDSKESNFVKFFINNNHILKLKKLAYSIANTNNFKVTKKFQDINYNNYDIVITNPPFSKFREFINTLIKYPHLKFIIIGPLLGIKYKDIFPLINFENKIRLGHTSVSNFFNSQNENKKVAAYWYTNLLVNKKNKDLKLTQKYNQENYPKYDNYNAINVNLVKNIPYDYNGKIGVPVSFGLIKQNKYKIIDKINPIINNKKIFERFIIQKI